MKKLLLFMLLALPLLSNAYDVEINGICYNLNKITKTAEVTYKVLDPWVDYRSDYFDSVNIPEKISYADVKYTVNSIGIDAFRNCTSLNSVTIPNSVKRIGIYAFDGCI